MDRDKENHGVKIVLVISPHPDDEMIGVGGTVIKEITERNEVYVATVTKGMPPLFSETGVERVRSEARQCHSTIGVSRVYS